MDPPPFSNIYFPAAISVKKIPFRLIFITFNHCSYVISSAGALIQIPALLWQKSSPPNSSTTCFTIASTCSLSVQSVWIAITFLPVFSASSFAVFFASSMSRSTIATSAPASANAVAVHLPIPLAAPVTKPFFPSSLIFSMIPIFVSSLSF